MFFQPIKLKVFFFPFLHEKISCGCDWRHLTMSAEVSLSSYCVHDLCTVPNIIGMECECI